MLNIFKKKCPVCKMTLAADKNYPAGYGKSFCSANCREEYRQQLTGAAAQTTSRGGCCGK